MITTAFGSRIRRARSGWRWLAAVLPAILCALPAFGQGLPMLPSPITTEELMGYADQLDLSNQQRLALLPLHDQYLDRYSALRDREMQKFEDDLLGLMSRIDLRNFAIPPRTELESLLRQYKDLLERVGQVDRGFFNSLPTILSEAQIIDIDRVRFTREVSMYQDMALGIAGEINPGAGVNLSNIVRGMELRPDAKAQVDPVIRSYETELLKLVRKVQEELEKVFVLVLDTIDRLGLRTMTLEEIGRMAQDEQFIQGLQVLFDESSKPIQEAIGEVGRLNLRTYRRLVPLLETRQRENVRQAYFERAYREAVRGVEHVRGRFTKALRLAEISDDQRGQITVERDSYEQRIGPLMEEIADRLEKTREYRTFAQFEAEDEGMRSDRVQDLVDRRQELNDGALRRLDMIIGEELAGRIAAGENREEEVWFEGVDGDRARVERARIAARQQAEEARAAAAAAHKPDVDRDPFLPGPIGAGRLDDYARRLGMDAADQTILQTLYDDYRLAYDEIFAAPADPGDAPANNDVADDEARRLVERARKRRGRFDAIMALDGQFFDQVGMVLLEEAAMSRLDLLRRSRAREARLHCIERQFPRFGRAGEGVIDVPGLLEDVDLDAAGYDAISESLLRYEESVRPDLDTMLDASIELARIEAVRGAMERGGEVPAALGQRQQQNFQTLLERGRSVGTVNRDLKEKLEQTLPEPASWQFAQAYNEKAYPDVYERGDSALADLESAFGFEDLSIEQRQRLRLIASDYRTNYEALSQELVQIAEKRDIPDFEGVIPVDMIRAEIRGERLKFQREEAAARARAQLRILLSEEQMRRLHKRDESETPADGAS